MEDRVQGIEQALQQAVQQLAAMQVQQAQTEQQLREAREAAATATAAAAAAGKGVRAGKGGVAGAASSGGGPHGFGIDTRMLGRPDTFDGSESKWGDWSMVMKAYAALCNASLVSAMPASEVEAQEKRNSDLRDQLDVEASVALYYMLVLLTRNEPLNIVVNSGAGEGLTPSMVSITGIGTGEFCLQSNLSSTKDSQNCIQTCSLVHLALQLSSALRHGLPVFFVEKGSSSFHPPRSCIQQRNSMCLSSNCWSNQQKPKQRGDKCSSLQARVPPKVTTW